MGRKFRLCKKKQYSRVTSLKVSIPLDKIQLYPVSIPNPLSFVVSLSRNAYMSTPFVNLDGLHRRVANAEITPVGKQRYF